MSDDHILLEWQLNQREKIRIFLHSYNNHECLSIRKFYYSGHTYLPTKQGITLTIRRLPELLTALQKANAFISGKK
jgi:hypothetical protein